MVALGAQPRESGRRSRVAAEQRRRFHRGMTSLLRSSDVLCADDLRFHRRLPHAAAPQRIANRYDKNVGNCVLFVLVAKPLSTGTRPMGPIELWFFRLELRNP